MTQIFRVELNGIDVTDHVDDVNISMSISRLYNNATFTLNSDYAIGINEQPIEIFYGSSVFTGFVSSTAKASRIAHTVSCKTSGATLGLPFIQDTDVTENATTALSLCALYEAEHGVTINYTSADLDFEGAYTRDGTILSTLTAIANVTGAMYYQDENNVIQIKPFTANDPASTEIMENEYFDYVRTSDTTEHGGVGEVIIGTKYESVSSPDSPSGTTVADPYLGLEVNDETGQLFVYVSPSTVLTASNSTVTGANLNLYLSAINRSEKKNVNNSLNFQTFGAIKTITQILLNGVVVSDYDFIAGTNVISFRTEKNGLLDIQYISHVQKGYVTTETTPLGEFFDVDITYKTATANVQGYVTKPSTVDSTSDVDNENAITIYLPDGDLNYVEGFTIETAGAESVLTFYGDGEEIPFDYTSTTGIINVSESTSLQPSGYNYIYETLQPVVTFDGATSNGVDIPFIGVRDANGDYFGFTEDYPNVSVSYTTTGGVPVVEGATLTASGVNYIAKADNNIVSYLGATSNGSIIPYTEVENTTIDGIAGDYFGFENDYPNVAIQYTTEGTVHIVKNDNIASMAITMEIGGVAGQDVVTYGLEGVNYYDLETIPNVLPQTIPVNVYRYVGIPLSELVGQTVTALGVTGSQTLTIGADGYVRVYVSADGTYKIPTDELTGRNSWIELKVDTVNGIQEC